MGYSHSTLIAIRILLVIKQNPTPPSLQPTAILAHFNFGQILGLAAVLAAPVGMFAPKAIAPLFGLVVVLGIIQHIATAKQFPRLSKALLYPALAIAIWAALSMLWSISPKSGKTLVFTLPIMFLAGVSLIAMAGTLRQSHQKLLERGLIFTVLLGIAILGFEVFSGALLHRIGYYLKGSDFIDGPINLFLLNTGATAITLLFWPTALLLWKKQHRLAVLALSLVHLVILLNSTSFSALAGFVVGLCFLGLAFTFSRSFHWIFGALLTIAVLGGPLMVKALPDGPTLSQEMPQFPVGVYPRVIIWQFVADRIGEAPVMGHGLRTSRDIPHGNTLIPYNRGKGENHVPGNTKAIPLHPHNGPLQMWLELGGVGAVLGLAFLLAILRAIHRLAISHTLKAVCYGQFACALLMGSASYGLWQGWWNGILWLTAAMTVALLPSDTETTGHPSSVL